LVSRRNYICLAVRGPQRVTRVNGGRGFGWDEEATADADTEEYVFSAIEQVCDEYPIHPDRIFLAGLCEGASLAYRLALGFPERFAGVMALNGKLPRSGPLLRLPAARRLRVFMGHG